MNMIRKILFIANYIRCMCHIFVYLFHRDKEVVNADISRWLKELNVNFNKVNGLIYLLAFYPEFRNVFYYRIGKVKYILNLICPRMSTLYIHTPIIGPGLFIQHGFATIISAKYIGKNCWINQQVTIGFSNKDDCPIILDDVTIHAGAKLIGKVVVGGNSVIGANAVVVKDVPENCVVGGVPAKIIKPNNKNNSPDNL